MEKDQMRGLSSNLLNFKKSGSNQRKVNTNPLDDSYGDHMLTLVKMKKREEELESKLESKKQEFAERMEMCALMKAQLKRRRDELDRHVANFQPILHDSELRRFKGIQKASAEMHAVSQNQQQISILASELKILSQRRLRLTEHVNSLAAVTKFMEDVRSDFPQDYIDDENMSTSAAVVARYQALAHANQYIKDKMQHDLNELTKLQQDGIELHQKHGNRVMMLTSQISELKRKLDRKVADNQSNEEKVQRAIKTYQYKYHTTFMVLSAIDNISQKCKKSEVCSSRTLDKSPVDMKLKFIQEQLIQWGLVAEHAFQQMFQDRESVSTSFAEV